MKLKLPNWGSLCNPNLLLNSDFQSGIINQKGQTNHELNNSTPTLTIDGWIGIGTYVSVKTNYINIFDNRGTGDSYLLQKFDNPINGDYTFYINVNYMSKGTLEIYIEGTDQTDKLTISTKGEYTHTFKNVSNGTALTLHLKGFNGDIYRMKFEKGSVFTGMPLWNEALELLKCQKYFVALKGDFVGASTYDLNNAFFTIPISTKLNKRPSVSFQNTLRVHVYTDENYYITPTNLAIFSIDSNHICLVVNVQNLNRNVIAMLRTYDDFIYLDAYDY